MGGLWVDYHLRTNLPRLFALGESNYSDHGANRLGANSLLQTLVDGLFVAPLTVPDELSQFGPAPVSDDVVSEALERTEKELRQLVERKGNHTPPILPSPSGRDPQRLCGSKERRGGSEQSLTGNIDVAGAVSLRPEGRRLRPVSEQSTGDGGKDP